jgi:hypothetical protein
MACARKRAKFGVEDRANWSCPPNHPQNHRYARAAEPALVPTFAGRLQQSQILRSLKVIESAKLG